MLCIFYAEPERVLNKQDQKLHEIRESRQNCIRIFSHAWPRHRLSLCLSACPTVCCFNCVPSYLQLLDGASASCCLCSLRVSVRYKCVALARLYFCAYLG